MERLAGRIMLLSGLKRGLLAIAAGAVGVLALPPVQFPAALALSFTLLVIILDGASGDPQHGFLRRLMPAFRIGWCFGFGYFVAGLTWLGNALMVEAEQFAWALPLAIVGLPAFLALFYGVATALARLFWLDGYGRILGLAFGFGLVEYMRGSVLTGFPWNTIGQGLMAHPVMMQAASIVSADGMTVLAVLIFAAPALLITRKGAFAGVTVAILLVASLVGFGLWSIRQAPAIAADSPVVRLVQPMVDQARKIDDKERAAIFEDHLAMTALPPDNGGKKPDIVIWPETSIPFILTDNPAALTRIAEVLDDNQVLLAGAVRSEPGPTGTLFYNAIYLIDGAGQIIGAYDKNHLVPFGEYLPFEALFRRFELRSVAAMIGGYTAGSRRDRLILPNGRELVPLICYEAIFPRELGTVTNGADAILNVTNDGWFGATAGPAQHFHQARILAAETGLPVLRASNSGISAVIDASGRVVSGLDYGARGVIDTPLPATRIPFADTSRRTLNFWLLLAATFVFAAATHMRLQRKLN